MPHWDLELAARYAKFIPRHNWCIKHKTRKHTFFINLFYLRTFSKKKKSSFLGPSASFFLGAYVKSLLLFLKCFLTRQFYEFSFLRCSFSSWHAHFLGILCFLRTFSVCTSCTVLYGTPCYYTRMWFSLLFVDFYFTLYITTKHNNNNGMRHETVWVDRTIDRML